MHRLRSSLLLLFVGLCLGSLAAPATAQSVVSVVDEMQARYNQQTETVDTYVVETNLYTSYNKKVMTDGEATYKTQTRMKGQGGNALASTSTPSAAYGLQVKRLKEHATYAGTETVNGTRCHALQIDDPSKVNPDMSGDEVESMTYYVDAEKYVPLRMVMKQNTRQKKGRRGGGSKPSTVTINMKDYQTTDGLTLPHRMEVQIDMDMSEKERKQMEKAMAQMKNLPEQQRKMMEKRMGGQMEMMKQMMSGEPIVVEVQSVQVNVELPEGMF
jgi:hypothetical protein